MIYSAQTLGVALLSAECAVGDGLAATGDERSSGCFGDGLRFETILERGSNGAVLVEAPDEVVESACVRGLGAFEPSCVQTIIDNLARPITRDKAVARIHRPGC